VPPLEELPGSLYGGCHFLRELESLFVQGDCRPSTRRCRLGKQWIWSRLTRRGPEEAAGLPNQNPGPAPAQEVPDEL